MDTTTKRKNNRTILILSLVFAVVFYLLIFQGGMCERYESKMQKQEYMRHYMDSIRSEEQQRILKRSQQ